MWKTEDDIFEQLAKHQISKEEALVMLKQLNKRNQQHNSIVLQNEYSYFDIQETVIEIVCKILHMDTSEINLNSTFKELGVDSIDAVEIVRDINSSFETNFDSVILYDYTTIPSFSKYIGKIIGDGRSVSIEKNAIDNSMTNEYVSNPYKENAIIENIKKIVGEILHLAEEEIDEDISFRDMGMDSISGVEIIRDINNKYNLNFDAATLYDYSSIKTLSRHVATFITEKRTEIAGKNNQTLNAPNVYKKDYGEEVEKKKIKDSFSNKLFYKENEHDSNLNKMKHIAIIGISGRFPGADNVHEFWNNLSNGVDSITEIPRDRWDINQYYDENPKAHGKVYTRYGGFVRDVDKFDSLFFHISPKEAEFMDPQQRLFLEEAWKALEDSGYSGQMLSGKKCGVFVGASTSDYGKKLESVGLQNTAEAFSGLSTAILPARISYILNLVGPSMTVDTACSSSLVAIHKAIQSILDEECSMAIAGGVRLMFTPDLFIQTCKIEMLSPDGKCKTFDKDADGIAISEGVGVVVLKELEEALRDGDHIYGVIRGSGINQDGKTNGITAPSAQSQMQLELDVYNKYNINPEDISYVEAHGTGTKLGDPIEVKALTQAFRKYTNKKNFCSIGSVKTNVGHATTASGVFSIIKVLLSLKHKKIPPSLNYRQPNEHIDFENSPFYVNTELKDWNVNNGLKRIAAISAFGFSGTNSHMIIEEWPNEY